MNKKRFKHNIPMDFPPFFDTQTWVYITHDIIPGIHNYYMISNHGLVYNRRMERLMTISPDSHGYASVHLSGTFGAATIPVHKLVGLAFVPNPMPGIYTFINHKDGNKMNPDAGNLEWTTPKMNTEHAINSGLFDPRKQSKLTLEQRDRVRELLSMKKYSCREISEMTGVSKSIVSHIRYGESWTNEPLVEQYSTRKR